MKTFSISKFFFEKISAAFLGELAAGPVPFGLGVQKYGFFLTTQILVRKIYHIIDSIIYQSAITRFPTANYGTDTGQKIVVNKWLK